MADRGYAVITPAARLCWAARARRVVCAVNNEDYMIKPIVAFSFALVVLLSGCQSLGDQPAEAPSAKQMSVNGTSVTYLEQGKGTPVVFVHGAISDHRAWEPQRETIAKRYRLIALDQRYFGVATWHDNGTQYSRATHVADLAAFVRQLNLAPVHLVGHSYGSDIALRVAVEHPELVRSLFLNEPPLTSILTNPDDHKVVSDEGRSFAPVVAAAKAGNVAEAARLLTDIAHADPGNFERRSQASRSMILDNARTTAPHFSAPPPPRVTCEQLGQLTMPVTITRGELTRPYFRVLSGAAHRCIPGSQLITVATARHASPDQNTAAFNEALLGFLARN